MFVLRFPSCRCKILLLNLINQFIAKFILKTLGTRPHFLTLDNFMKISVLRVFFPFEFLKYCMKAKHTYLLLSLISVFSKLLKIRYSYYFVYLEMVLWSSLLLSLCLAFNIKKIFHVRSRPIISLVSCKSLIWEHSP